MKEDFIKRYWTLSSTVQQLEKMLKQGIHEREKGSFIQKIDESAKLLGRLWSQDGRDDSILTDSFQHLHDGIIFLYGEVETQIYRTLLAQVKTEIQKLSIPQGTVERFQIIDSLKRIRKKILLQYCPDHIGKRYLHAAQTLISCYEAGGNNILKRARHQLELIEKSHIIEKEDYEVFIELIEIAKFFYNENKTLGESRLQELWPSLRFSEQRVFHTKQDRTEQLLTLACGRIHIPYDESLLRAFAENENDNMEHILSVVCGNVS